MKQRRLKDAVRFLEYAMKGKKNDEEWMKNAEKLRAELEELTKKGMVQE